MFNSRHFQLDLKIYHTEISHSALIFEGFSPESTFYKIQKQPKLLSNFLKGAFRGKKLDIGELRRLHIKRTFISLSTFPDISLP